MKTNAVVSNLVCIPVSIFYMKHKYVYVYVT